MRIDTVTYTINWGKLLPGYSFFVPCIDAVKARATLDKVSKRLGLTLVTKVVIQDGVKGLRVWRV